MNPQNDKNEIVKKKKMKFKEISQKELDLYVSFSHPEYETPHYRPYLNKKA